MSNKNTGPTLYFSQFGGERPIPPEFIAAMERTEERTSVPNEVGPEELSDTIVESHVETDRKNERKLVTIKKKSGVVGPLLDFRTTDQGSAVQVEATLFRTGATGYPIAPTATTNVAVKDLGNTWSIQEVATEGTWVNGVFVPGVFSSNVFERERPSVIPEEFGVTTATTRTDSAGTAVDPTLSGTELRERQEQVTQFKKRVEVVTEPDPTAPVVRDQGRDTNDSQQDVTVTRTLLPVGTAAAIASATRDVSVKQISDTLKVEETRVVAGVAGHERFGKERPNLVPEKFRSDIPTVTTGEESAGLAVAPTLSGTELAETQEQITEFKRRVTTTTQELPTLPVSKTGHETNEYQQDVTVIEEYRAEGANTAPTVLTDVGVDNRGDGRVVETRKTRPEIPGHEVFSLERPDPLPAEFRAALPISSTEVDSAGTAATPSALAALEIAKTETQVTKLVKRVKRYFHTGTTVTLTDGDYDGPTDGRGSKFDAVVGIQRFLAVGIQSVAGGFGVLFDRLKDLGNGQSVREVGTIATYPTLVEEISTLEGLRTIKTKSLVPTGTAHPGTPFTSQFPLDSKRTMRTVDSAIAVVYDSYIKSFAGSTNIDLPPELIELSPYVEGSAGVGNYNENGFYTLAGQGSGGVSLRGNAQGSASILTDLGFKLRQPWGVNVPCMHYLFYISQPATRAQILAKLATFVGGVQDWPKFVPEALNFVCQGQKATAQTIISANASDSIHTNYNGDIQHQGSVRTTGVGNSYEVGGSIKVVRIPPTIHGTLSVGAFNAVASFSASGTISTGINSQSGAVSGQVNGSIFPTSVAATGGQSTITGALGLRLYRPITELAGLDYVKVHCEVVNFTEVV